MHFGIQTVRIYRNREHTGLVSRNHNPAANKMTSKKVKVQSHEEDEAEQMVAKSDSGEDSSDDENPDIYKGDEVGGMFILVWNHIVLSSFLIVGHNGGLRGTQPD